MNAPRSPRPYQLYRDSLVERFWEYQKNHFSDHPEYCERPKEENSRPPVFIDKFAYCNVLTDNSLSIEQQKTIIQTIPVDERHRWFGSMTSSQALAQSVFGALRALNKLYLLENIKNDQGNRLFSPISPDVQLEYSVDYLGEPRQTSIDVFSPGNYRIAIECKLTEEEVGTCSRPKLNKKMPEYCDGSYERKANRSTSCPLSERGVLYWRYIPEVFHWLTHECYDHCPIRETYQLVRNILAVSVWENGKVDLQSGHVVLLYDERNPEFQLGGKGYKAWEDTHRALKNPLLLRECTWQRVVKEIRKDSELDWLADGLGEKYGF